MKVRTVANIPDISQKDFINGIVLWVRQGKAPSEIGPEIARQLGSHITDGSWMEVYDEDAKEWTDLMELLRRHGIQI